MGKSKKKILILGVSGFLGKNLYKELYPYFDVYGTYLTPNPKMEKNKQFFLWDAEQELPGLLLEQLKPDLIISAFRCDFKAFIYAHFDIINYLIAHQKKLIFISSSNVFDAFTNYPSYEYDKTLSQSKYGLFQIKIENALLRLPNHLYNIVRLPMVFGYNSPKINEIRWLYDVNEPIEVFPNVVINATVHSKFTQQIHYIINRKKQGVFHLGSTDLIHHNELIEEICNVLQLENPIF
jgi:dTDP-4-dehydrorhamnose reductase